MKTSAKAKISCLGALIWIFSNAFSQKAKENPISEKKITVCHLSDDYKVQSISIGISALEAHLKHGDAIGDCNENNSPLKLSFNKTDVKCNGGSDGAIDLKVSISNGNPKYNFLWSTGATTEDISNLKAGNYSVTVSIGKGLTASGSIIINEPSILSAGSISKNISCAGGKDGEILVTPTGGTYPYSFFWSANAGLQNGEKAIGLQKGIYRVNIIDANGCSTFSEKIIEEPLPISSLVFTNDVRCNGGNDGFAEIQPGGGTPPFSISWSQNAGMQNGETAVNLSNGIYLATITDSKSCTFSEEIIIQEPDLLTAQISAANVTCSGGNNGSATLLPQGGIQPYSYQWCANAGGQNSEIATKLTQGVYSCSITDLNGCQFVSSISIEEPAPIAISFSCTNENCSNPGSGNATANVTGGVSPYNYQWSLNSTTQSQPLATNLTQGTYGLFVSDQNGCSASKTFSIIRDKCDCMLRTEDCGATMISLNQFIYCNPVNDATNYQWEFFQRQTGVLKTIVRGYALNNFHLTWVPGILYGKTYEVRVKPYVNGAWKDYGPVCQITVPGPIPSTKMRNEDCGISTTSLNQQLFCELVPGAQNYQWEFTNSSLGFTKIVNRGSNSLSFTFGWATGIQYGNAYEVRVRANVGGEWGSFASLCQISLVYPIPTTKVRNSDCGITLASLTQNINCDAVAGATDFQWEISNHQTGLLTTYARGSSNTNFQFGWLPNIQFSTTYSVRVKGKVAGEWAEFGFECQITTPNAPIAPRQGNFNEEEETSNKSLKPDHQLSVFPNPSKGESIDISFSGQENADQPILIEVYDILGNKVFSRNSTLIGEGNLIAKINRNGELTTGIYFLNVVSDNKNYYDRIVIK